MILEVIYFEVFVYFEDVFVVNSNVSILLMSLNNFENMISGVNLKRVLSSFCFIIFRKFFNSSELSRKFGYVNSGFKRLVFECIFSFGINGMD